MRGKIVEGLASEQSDIEGGFVTITQAMAYLGLCRASLYKHMDGGAITFAKFGKSRRILRSSLAAFARASLVNTAE